MGLNADIYGINKNFIIKVVLLYQSSIILNAITKSGIRELWVAYIAQITRFTFFHDTVKSNFLGPLCFIPGLPFQY
jgi:hypothetical protein